MIVYIYIYIANEGLSKADMLYGSNKGNDVQTTTISHHYGITISSDYQY